MNKTIYETSTQDTFHSVKKNIKDRADSVYIDYVLKNSSSIVHSFVFWNYYGGEIFHAIRETILENKTFY